VTKAKELFRQLVSDCCKKLWETEKRRKIKQFTRNEKADAELEENLPIMDTASRIKTGERYPLRISIINTRSPIDVTDPGPPSVYNWSEAQKTHLVVLTTLSLFTIHEAIKGRFNMARYKV